MKGHEREAVALIQGLVHAAGLSTVVQQGGKHLAVIVTGRGVKHKFPISGSPRSSSCQLRQIRQQVTAWLESVGAVDPRGVPGERRRREVRDRRPRPVPVPSPEPVTRLSRDPWEGLAALSEKAA